MIDLSIILNDLNIEYFSECPLTPCDNPLSVDYIEKDLQYEIPAFKNQLYLLMISESDLVGKPQKWMKPLSQAKIVLVLCHENKNLAMESIRKYFQGSILVIDNKKYHAQQIYYSLKDALDRANAFQKSLIDRHYLELLDLLKRDATISDIERFGSKLLNNPMIITDETFFVLAYSQDRSVPDPIWEEIVSNKYSPPTLVSQTNIDGFWNRLENSSMPLFVNKNAFHDCARRAVASIKIGAKTKGYIALLQIDSPITSTDLLILQMLAEVLSIKINEENVISNAIGQMKADFTNDLLSGNMHSESMILSRAKTLDFIFKEWNTVLCITSENQQHYIGGELEDFRYLLKGYSDMCMYTFDGTKAFFILSFKNKTTWNRLMDDTMEEYIEKKQYLCTLSLPAAHISDISKCYQQVLRMNRSLALYKHKLNKKIYPYNRVVPYNMVVSLFQSDDKELYRNLNLEILLESDHRTGSEYVNTLRCFFQNNQNTAATAKSLFIHRNTVNYRLNGIRKLIEDDFDDHLIRLHLQLAIMSNDMLK